MGNQEKSQQVIIMVRVYFGKEILFIGLKQFINIVKSSKYLNN